VLPVTGNGLPKSLSLILAAVLALAASWGLRLWLRKLTVLSDTGE
jgi:hypothetical protein